MSSARAAGATASLRSTSRDRGWVEHDPEEIWAVRASARRRTRYGRRRRAADLRAIGIANQRETTLSGSAPPGRPVARAIVWQDRRTARAAASCRPTHPGADRPRADPYFSATKLEWLLARTDARPSELAFGTVDSWLVWKLTDGRCTPPT